MVKSKQPVELGQVASGTGQGVVSLGKLMGKTVNLVGGMDLSGSLGILQVNNIEDAQIRAQQSAGRGTNIKVNEIDDGDFQIAGNIKVFQANAFSNGSLVADSIGQVKIKAGDFGADVEAAQGDILGITTPADITGKITAEGTIKKIMTKKGSFKGVARAGTDIGMVQAMNFEDAILSSGDDIKKVVIKGDILKSYILGGYDIGNDCAFGPNGEDFLTGGDVLSVTAKGEFSRSYIAAGTLPNAPLTSSLTGIGDDALEGGSIGKVKFGEIDYYDAETFFGLFAADEIKPFKDGRDWAKPEGFFVM